MDLTCEFGLDYRPTNKPDPVLRTHVENCEDCRQQVSFV